MERHSKNENRTFININDFNNNMANSPEEVIIKLIDNKIIAIIRTLIKNKSSKMRLTDIAKESQVPTTSTFRILKRLEKLDIVKHDNINKLKLYQLENNKITHFLKEIIKLSPIGLEYFINELKKNPLVNQIIIQGIEKENSVNLIILGNAIDYNDVKKIAQEVFTKYNYTITYLILTKEQYEQMRNMGLYKNDQKILYNDNDQKKE